MISIAEARAILAVHGEPVTRTERVAVSHASGRVLARAIMADRDVPPFARAAMDGYAVRASDTTRAARDHGIDLDVLETVFSGMTPTTAIRPGTCAAIATGAPIPSGADAVVIIEHTARDGDRVRIFEAVPPGQHIGRAGSDIVAGELALGEETVLTPARLAVASAIGVTELEVYARPRVAILSTGDEIVAPGGRLAAGQIFDANTTGLEASVAAHGGDPVVAPRTRDDRDALARAFDACLKEDMVLFSGGSSVGERDFALEILGARGTILFEGLQLKPGKPTIFADVGGVPVFGLPGNPVSCLTNMYLFVAPMLCRIAHLPPPVQRVVTARLSADVTSPAGRHQVYPVRLEGDEAVPVFKTSGEITSLAYADGFFEIPADMEHVDAATIVNVILF
jgi:molybdenum cofactor synthesis domain-containing protein